MATESDQEVKTRFMLTLTEHFSRWPTGYYNQVGQISESLKTLNDNLESSTLASNKLALRIHQVTVAGVLIALGALLLEVYKVLYC